MKNDSIYHTSSATDRKKKNLLGLKSSGWFRQGISVTFSLSISDLLPV